MYNLPTSIIIGEQSFTIRDNGDFRMVLDCFDVMNDFELSKDEQIMVMLMLFYEDINSFEDLNKLGDLNEASREMMKFFNCGKEDEITANKPKLIDWKSDANLICAAINNVAKIEIRAESYIHWWTFMGYYMSIGDCALSHVVSIRHKIVTGNKLEKHEREFKRDNPQYFAWNSKSREQIEADNLAKEMWNSTS